MLWLVKIWQVSSCRKFMQHLETCLLIAEADRVFCHLALFLTVFFYWMYKVKYICYQDPSVIYGWFVYCVFGWKMHRKQVKVSSRLQANFIGRVTLSPWSTLPALLTCFVMRDILCYGLKFEIILKFSMENTLNSRKRENIIIVDRKQLSIFQMFIIKLRNPSL